VDEAAPLPTTPAERIAVVRGLVERGKVTPDEGRELLDVEGPPASER
jgi:polyhydroxyalkanoate synthesis regulator phasin